MRRPVPTRHPGADQATCGAQRGTAAVTTEQPSAFHLDRIRNHVANRQFGPTIECDQAVFTSIRSPMGEGYRVIARSPGVTRTEAAEITTRAPSHGGLCLETDDAFGFLALPLESGRYCILYARHAGTEHTARGGHRVHTLAVLLTAEQFDRFSGNAVRMLAAVAKGSPAPLIEDRATLEPLHVSIPVGASPFLERPEFAALITAVISKLLAGDACIIRGAHRPLTLLETAIELTPHSTRSKMSVLAGITYAPNRGITLSLVEGDERVIARSIQGHGVTWLGWDDPLDLDDHPARAWLTLVNDRISQSRVRTLLDFVRRTEPGATVVDFNRLARIIRDIETANAADLDPQTRQTLHDRYLAYPPKGSLENDLCKRIIEWTTPPPLEPSRNAANTSGS